MYRVDSPATTAHTVAPASEMARVAPEPRPWDKDARDRIMTAETARETVAEKENGVFI